MSHYPSNPLLKIHVASETLHAVKKKKGCLRILLKSQGVSSCDQFLNLDHSVVINMHWKVLCFFCRSHGSLICCVLMYSIYSGLFSWANLATCQTSICASTKCAQIDGLFDLLERETSHHGALYNFVRMRFPGCTHHIICECGESLEWDMYFMETISVLNFVVHFI